MNGQADQHTRLATEVINQIDPFEELFLHNLVTLLIYAYIKKFQSFNWIFTQATQARVFPEWTLKNSEGIRHL